jgi:DNA polymerase I-like protein with 3'-5' exonuclease and polymerase domains
LLETRIEAFLAASDAVGGKLPIPIHYYGADTTGRDSGWAYNPQNLPRVSGKPSDALRNSLKAPYGQKVVVADLSGIELRVNHFLWKVPSSMALYQADPEKADLYKDFACMMYGITPEEVTKGQRQYAKACQLGLGFGAGAATFVRVAKTMGGIVLELDESKTTVDKWRSAYSEIKAGWKTCQNAIRNIAAGIEAPIDPWELCWSHPEGIRTPHGMIRYPNLHQEVSEEDGKKEWWYGQGRHRARLTGPKICENIVQHLARNVVMGNALTVKKLTGYIPAHRVHDELVYIVHEDQAQDVLDVVQETMRTPPVWWPELIV